MVEIQSRLVELGYLSGEPGGLYDRATERAVESFQNMNGILENGVATPQTVGLMTSDLAKPYVPPPDEDDTSEAADGDSGEPNP